MGLEIERKFLVRADIWTPEGEGEVYRQGYLSSAAERVVRVRLCAGRGFLTIKGPSSGISRSEYEYEIPLGHAAALLDELCEKPLIEKTRHREVYAGRVWEIDVFHGDSEGLVLAEIELQSETDSFELPPWVGEDVSHDARYFNSNLAGKPFKTLGGG